MQRNWERVQRNRQWLDRYLQDKSCIDCGNENRVVFEFDHLDPAEKVWNVADLVRQSYGLETIKSEIDKCEIVCANCHRIRTYQRRQALAWCK
jgi:hypothetical protein